LGFSESPPASPGVGPGLWNTFYDAKTGELLWQFNGIDTLSQASGPGGNAKVARTWTNALDVEPSGSQFQMNTARLVTTNMNNGTAGAGTIVVGPLSPISDAPIDDAHGFAEITLNMLRDWQGYNSIDNAGFVIRSRVHYSSNYENAFWDGTQMTYGDGATTFYPLSGSVDVVAHEIDHGFTTFHSNLIYSRQSGGMNESFSDIAGEVAEAYYRGTAPDFDVGRDIFRGNTALRFMFDEAGLADIDVHLSTGSSFGIQRWATRQGGFWATQQWMAGDFNGDGKADLAKAFIDGGLADIDVHPSTGSSFGIQRWATQQGGFWDGQKWMAGDFNGDGKADVAKVFDDGGLADIDVHPSTGASFGIQRWATRQGGFWATQQWMAADFNGDGKADLAKAFIDGGLADIDVHPSTGAAFGIERWATQQGGFADAQKWLAGDFNGNGLRDVGKAFVDAGLADLDVHLH
jgi:Thermolysin metallopeptidase, catalytic domain/Thermolysin metallopeptidase, alpha-helical domain